MVVVLLGVLGAFFCAGESHGETDGGKRLRAGAGAQTASDAVCTASSSASLLLGLGFCSEARDWCCLSTCSF